MMVRSLRHGTEEMLHARILTDYIEIQDFQCFPDAHEDSRTIRHLDYTATGGSTRVKRFEKEMSLAWQDYTDFDGHMVPLDIIKKMKQVERPKAGAWEGRGVEVSAKTWKVLTDWRDEKVAKDKASKAKVTGKKGDEETKANSGYLT